MKYLIAEVKIIRDSRFGLGSESFTALLPKFQRGAALRPDVTSLTQADYTLAAQHCVHAKGKDCAELSEGPSETDLLLYKSLG